MNDSAELETEEQEDDGYTPPQEDYLPPGLQVDLDHLPQLLYDNVFFRNMRKV